MRRSIQVFYDHLKSDLGLFGRYPDFHERKKFKMMLQIKALIADGILEGVKSIAPQSEM